MSKLNFKTLFLCYLIVVSSGYTSFAKTIYVDDNAAGANDGSSWKNAYNYLQDALVDADSAEKPVVIKVAEGIYKPDRGKESIPNDQKATFRLINGVTLKGGFAGCDGSDPDNRDFNLYETILSGDLKGNDTVVEYPKDLLDDSSRNDNSYCVLTSMILKESMLDGFTITAAIHHGMYNKNSSPTVINCVFRENRAFRWGGGICNENGSLNVKRCTFSQNAAKYGGGVWNWRGSLFLTSCLFIGNSAKYGGAIYNYDNSHPHIYDCVFRRNFAKYGVGIYSNNNCRSRVTNCTFAGNSADRKGGVLHNIHYSCVILTNSILWHNAPDEHDIVNYAHSSSMVSYCNIQDGSRKHWFGEGCIDVDPLFVGADNLQLLPDSPCIDTGDCKAVPFEIASDLNHKRYVIDNTINMGALEGGSSLVPRIVRQIRAQER